MMDGVRRIASGWLHRRDAPVLRRDADRREPGEVSCLFRVRGASSDAGSIARHIIPGSHAEDLASSRERFPTSYPVRFDLRETVWYDPARLAGGRAAWCGGGTVRILRCWVR
jgi:hypothetical protein